MTTAAHHAPRIVMPDRQARTRPAIMTRIAGARLFALLACSWAVIVVATYYRGAVSAVRYTDWRVATILGDGNWSLPHVTEALAWDVRALAGAAILLASAVILGTAIGRAARWRYDDALERLPIAASLGVGALAYLGLGAAALGSYRPWTLRVLATLPIAAALIVWCVRRLVRLASRSDIAYRAHNARWWHAVQPAGAEQLWAACAFAAALLALVAALAPETEFDAVWFHLYFPHLFLQRGRLVDLPSQYVSLYPMTWELWFGYGLAVGGQAAAKLLHFACLPLTACMVYQTTRRYAPMASPWLAVALFATVPLVLWDASTAYVDLPLALYVSIALYTLARYVESHRMQWLLLAAINLGLGLATKHLTLVVLALMCPGLAIAIWWRERSVIRPLRAAILLGLLSLLLPLPWYIRSWAASGNPVFPELYGLFGAPASRWSATSQAGLDHFMAHFGRPRTPFNQLTLPWHMTMHAGYYDGTLGPLFLLLLPFLALGIGAAGRAERGRGARVALGAFAAMYIVMWASPIASFQMRWMLPVVPALAVLGAIAFARIEAAVHRARPHAQGGALTAALGLLLTLNLPLFTSLHESAWDVKHRDHAWGDRDAWLNSTLHGVPLAVVLGAQSPDDYIRRHVPTADAWRAIGTLTPANARVLAYSAGDNLYSTRDEIPALSDFNKGIAFAPIPELSRALARARARGITHLLLDKHFLARSGFSTFSGWDVFALTAASTRARDYDLMYEDDNALVYRIR